MKASSASLHGHDKSLHVSFSLEEVAILAKEIYDDTVAEVTFSLFTYWVCGSRENYEQAKLHIRELGLDQGYHTSRITNPHLRKLVEECHHYRARYEANIESPKPEEKPESSRRWLRWSPRNPSLRSLSMSHSSGKPASNGPQNREPVYASKPTAPGKFTPRKSSAPTILSSRWRKGSGLPSTSTMSEVAPWSGLSPNREFPPNTPDRPAPLNIKHSGSSTVTSAPKSAIVRSVSTPIRPRQGPRSAGLPSNTMEATESLLPLLPDAQNEAVDGSSSVYSSVGDHDDEDYQYGTIATRRLFLNEADETDFVTGPEAAAPDTAGVGSTYEQVDETDVASLRGQDVTAATQSLFARHTRSVSDTPSNPFGPHAEYASSSSQDAPSNDAKSRSSRGHSSYALSNNGVRMYSFRTGPAPTPAQRRAAAQSRREAITSGSTSSASNISRPLPLRHNASERMLQGSAANVEDEHTPSVITFPQQGKDTASPPVTSFRRYDIPASNGISSSNLDRSLTPHHYQSEASHSQFHGHLLRSATQPGLARTGNELPIAGMREMTLRVGANALRSRSRLPSRAILSSDAGNGKGSPSLTSALPAPTAPNSQAPHPLTQNDALSEAYKSTTLDYMTDLLRRTRIRGALLPTVERRDMGPSEIAWRDANSELIRAIYGRDDIFLARVEKRLVDRIAEEVKRGCDWVGELFRDQDRE